MIVIDANCYLLSDAEVVENVVKDILGGDFAAGDFSEVMEAAAEVFGNKVGRSLIGKGLLRMTKGLKSLPKGVVVPHVCHYGMSGVKVGWQG